MGGGSHRFNQSMMKNPNPTNPLQIGQNRFNSPQPKKPQLGSYQNSNSSSFYSNSNIKSNNLSFRRQQSTPVRKNTRNARMSRIATPNRVLIDKIAEESGFRTSQLAGMNESFLDIGNLSLDFDDGHKKHRNYKSADKNHFGGNNVLFRGRNGGNRDERASHWGNGHQNSFIQQPSAFRMNQTMMAGNRNQNGPRKRNPLQKVNFDGY